MATLANLYGRFFDRGAVRGTETPTARSHGATPRVRAFANEDIYFFTKRIDNSRVVRQADPKSGGVCWKLIGSVVAAVVLLVGVLLPGAYGLLAGYQIQSLHQEGLRLDAEQSSLEVEEAELVSPKRMEELARLQEFVDPPPQKVVYLDSSKLAMNQK
jgi:hypothetical protein